MKTAISIPDSIFDEAEDLAGHLGMSRSSLYTAAITEFMNAHREDRVLQALNDIYSTEPSSLEKPLAKMQRKTIGHEKW